MPWNSGLQAPHLNVAAYVSPLRVVAGPGTGKTFALMRRVARLLEEGAQTQRILAVVPREPEVAADYAANAQVYETFMKELTENCSIA